MGKGRKGEKQTQQNYMSKQCRLRLPPTVGLLSTKPGTNFYDVMKFKVVSKTSFKGKLGVVAGKVGINTLAVDVLERHTHMKYGKVFSRTKRYKVHVEENILSSFQKGDKIAMH